jgi:pimeloyl-ACP methyl ester carboxylesterase
MTIAGTAPPDQGGQNRWGRAVTTWLNTSFEMRFRVIDGLTIRYAQSEDCADHALLLSPWPESLLAFLPVWESLAQHAHLVAIDLPGFGHSQHSDALSSPRAMAEFVLRAADAFGLDHPHLLGPGTGTASALFAAAREPGRLRSLVVGSGAAAVPLQLGGALKDWVEAPDLEEFRRADPRRLLEVALSSAGQHALADPVREDYLSSCYGTRMAESIRYVRSYPAELPVLSGLLSQIATPVQIIAGRYDTNVPAINAEYLHQRLPHARLDIIDAGHFTWEDAPGEYAGLVTRWWDSGYLSSAVEE